MAGQRSRRAGIQGRRRQVLQHFEEMARASGLAPHDEIRYSLVPFTALRPAFVADLVGPCTTLIHDGELGPLASAILVDMQQPMPGGGARVINRLCPDCAKLAQQALRGRVLVFS